MSTSRCPKCKCKNAENYKFCSQCGEKNVEMPTMTSYNFVVMGPGGVGKSAIVIRYISGKFESKYDPTIEDRYQKIIDYEGAPCKLEILDTAGQETFSAMREMYMKNGEAFALIYSITSLGSLQELAAIHDGIRKFRPNTEIPIILVGNKCDIEKKRKVTSMDAKLVAREFRCPFIETSAKMNINIEQIFHTLIEQFWDIKGRPKKSKNNSKDGGCVVF